MKKLSTVKVPHHKGTALMQSVRIPTPDEVLLPMVMHSGSPAKPVVQPGDRVRVGQLIAEEDGRNSSPVYATVSGTVSSIEDLKNDDGSVKAVRIKSDGLMEKDPSVVPPEVNDLDSFLAAVRKSGIVGLGGAAFPLWAKLDAVRRNKIETVLVNGAECEPYATCDNRTMLENSDLIVKGVELLRTYLKAERFVIGIESNKPKAIEEMNRVFANDSSVEVKVLEARYPQGAKQVLLYNATGKVVQEGQRLASLGVIIINVSSLAKMAGYMTDGMPLVERIVTVDGSAVSKPCNLTVPIGTPIKYLIDSAGGLKCDAGKIILGGPMMGRAVDSLDEPIIKATNAVLVFNSEDAKNLEPTNCIHCGRCVDACPLNLNPVAYAHALNIKDDDERKFALLSQERVGTCMECGCCAFVCPAHRPLVDNNRRAKQFVWAMRAKKKEEVK